MRRRKNHRGAALLVVMVVVMVITVLALGYIERSDMELACGNNVVLKTQTEYVALGALMRSQAWVLAACASDPEYEFPVYPPTADKLNSDEYGRYKYVYILDIGDATPSADPNDTTYTRTVACTAYAERRADQQELAWSKLVGELQYDSSTLTGFYRAIHRPEQP